MIVWDPFHCKYLGPGNFYDILKAFLRWAIFHGLCSQLLYCVCGVDLRRLLCSSTLMGARYRVGNLVRHLQAALD